MLILSCAISGVVWHWFLQQGCLKTREQQPNGCVLCVPFSSVLCWSSSGCKADGTRWKKPLFATRRGHFQCCSIEHFAFLIWVYISQKTCKANWVFHAIAAYLTSFKNVGWNPWLWADVGTFRGKWRPLFRQTRVSFYTFTLLLFSCYDARDKFSCIK